MKIKRGPGRPKGSKNREYAAAVEIPAACPKCGDSDLKALPISARLKEISGVLRDGYAYRAIRYQNCRCGCGQYVTVRTYLPAEKK